MTSGCLRNVLSGKAYAKALFCLKTVCEALERLLLEVFLEEKDISISPESLLEIIKTCNCQNHTLVLQDESIIAIIQEYLLARPH